ncbi:methionine--tRNA ligase [bacterium]|nr:methionine--tRNA ligase [bacterium]
MKNSFYLTTAISYVNGKPHVGHAYEFITSDAIVRYHRMLGQPVFFLSGVDEHSAQVEKAARDEGLDTPAYCDKMSVIFQDLHTKLGSSIDYFIRTSEPRHHVTTQEMLQRAYDNGDIYKGTYSGYYCYACEAFYQEADLDEGKLCPVHKQETPLLEQENYFFRLSNYTEKLKEHYDNNPDFVSPENFKNEMRALMDRGLQDISISRSTTKWGIELPWDKDHVAYVWFDALSNYLTGVGFLNNEDMFKTFWPCDHHVIGKDITRFHAVLWPAMLMSCGIELPKQILVHGFIYHRGEKMSKTIGNIVDPDQLLDTYGCDPMRYFLLREVAFGQDGNYSEESLISRYNADLANDIGNLFSRVCAMIKKYRKKEIPSVSSDDAVREQIQKTIHNYKNFMNANVLHNGVASVWELIGFANRYVDESEPWALAKDETKAEQLDRVLLNLAEMLHVVAVLVFPFMPNTSLTMLERLGLPHDGQTPLLDQLETPDRVAGNTVDPGKPLFPRLEKNEA